MSRETDFWFGYDRTVADVTDLNGKTPDLSEPPVKITVFAAGPGRKYPFGHVQLEYEEQIIDFEAKGMRDLKADQPQIFDAGIRHYYIYPGRAGLEPERLCMAISACRAAAGEYNMMSNNCADQVRFVLEKAGAENVSTFGLMNISVPEKIARWCEENGTRIDVRTTNLYRYRRPDEFLCVGNMLRYAKGLLAGKSEDERWLPEGSGGAQVREFMLRKAASTIRHAVRRNRNDFGTSKVFADYLHRYAPNEAFLERFGISDELEKTVYAAHPEREQMYLLRRRQQRPLPIYANHVRE